MLTILSLGLLLILFLEGPLSKPVSRYISIYHVSVSECQLHDAGCSVLCVISDDQSISVSQAFITHP